MIDITMTAVMRPDILETTLRSFHDRFWKDHPVRLVLNLDPTGGPTIEYAHLGSIVYKYVTELRMRNPHEPHFGRAFHWCWSQADTEFVINLEDDWECLQDIDLDEMILCMRKNPRLALLRLPWIPCGMKVYNSWGVKFPWNGEYFACPEEDKGVHAFCGHPSLIRYDFMEQVWPLLDPNRNPEKQIKGHNPGMRKVLDKWDFGVWGYPAAQAMIKDLGRSWKKANGWDKEGNPAVFTHWSKVWVKTG